MCKREAHLSPSFEDEGFLLPVNLCLSSEMLICGVDSLRGGFSTLRSWARLVSASGTASRLPQVCWDLFSEKRMCVFFTRLWSSGLYRCACQQNKHLDLLKLLQFLWGFFFLFFHQVLTEAQAWSLFGRNLCSKSSAVNVSPVLRNEAARLTHCKQQAESTKPQMTAFIVQQADQWTFKFGQFKNKPLHEWKHPTTVPVPWVLSESKSQLGITWGAEMPGCRFRYSAVLFWLEKCE